MHDFLLVMFSGITLFENISAQNKEATNQSLNECPGVFTSGLLFLTAITNTVNNHIDLFRDISLWEIDIGNSNFIQANGLSTIIT